MLDSLISNLVKYENLTLNRAMAKALFQSAGKYKRNTLRKMGFPYAERHGAVELVGKRHRRVDITAPPIPYGDPARINIQKGNFYLSWVKTNSALVGNSIVGEIKNISPYAEALEEGIPGRTIPRPLIARIIPVVNYWRERNIALAFRDSLK